MEIRESEGFWEKGQAVNYNSLSAFVSGGRVFKRTQENWRQCRVIKNFENWNSCLRTRHLRSSICLVY